MNSRRLAQMRLSLEANTLWEQLPRQTRESCIDLFGQMLKAVIAMERMEEASHEREADSASS